MKLYRPESHMTVKRTYIIPNPKGAMHAGNGTVWRGITYPAINANKNANMGNGMIAGAEVDELNRANEHRVDR